MSDVYQQVTDRILEALESGIVPWHQPWKNLGGLARNHVTNKSYQGINVMLLEMAAVSKGYRVNRWLGYKQAQDAGGHVRKGEKATMIVRWVPVKNDDDDDENGGAVFPVLLAVFNVEQCEGIEYDLPSVTPLTPITAACSVVDGYSDRPTIAHGGDSASYSLDNDHVQMPLPGQFGKSEDYYRVLFHELIHSTRHGKRLNRGTGKPNKFGGTEYSKEELVAEMGTAMLCGMLTLDVEIEQSAAYIQGWLSVLKNNKKWIITAAAQAQKAIDYMLKN